VRSWTHYGSRSRQEGRLAAARDPRGLSAGRARRRDPASRSSVAGLVSVYVLWPGQGEEVPVRARFVDHAPDRGSPSAGLRRARAGHPRLRPGATRTAARARRARSAASSRTPRTGAGTGRACWCARESPCVRGCEAARPHSAAKRSACDAAHQIGPNRERNVIRHDTRSSGCRRQGMAGHPRVQSWTSIGTRLGGEDRMRPSR
jgi:hypothetical protein